MNLQLLLLGFAILSVVLGFIALLSQRIYLDPKTMKPTEVEVPILGKMKSNYPSLVFVFLGFALIFYMVYSLSKAEPVTWQVSGVFLSDNPDIKWSPSNLSVFPCGITPKVDKDTGKFSIMLGIKKGEMFEEKYQGITYTDKFESITIIPSDELAKYNNQDPSSLLDKKTENMRLYKPLKLIKMQE